MIVLLPPLFSDNLRLMTIGENPAVETVSSKCSVETLDKRILPRTVRLDVQPLARLVLQPLLQGIRNELRAIVAAHIVRRSSKQKQPLQLLNNLT